MKITLLITLLACAATVNAFAQSQTTSLPVGPDNTTSTDTKSLGVSSPADPRIEHPQFFWQAQDHENAVTPETSFLANHAGADFNTNDTKTTTIGLEYQRGVTRHFAVSLDADYSTSQTITGSAFNTNGSTAFSTDGLQDLLLSLKGFSGEGATRIYYGLAFDLSLQSAQYSSNDGINYTGNNYSGGQSVIPSLGIAWILSPRNTLGLFSSYQVRDQRAVEFNDQGAMSNYVMTGGNILKGGAFLEKSYDSWKLGVTAGVENDEAAFSPLASVAGFSVPSAQLFGVATVYSAIKAGSNLDILPSVAYETEIDALDGGSGTSQMNITMAARMVF